MIIHSLYCRESTEPDLAAEQFANDFRENEGNIVNFTLIRTEDDGLPNFLEVALLPTGKEHRWTITEEHVDSKKKLSYFNNPF